MSQFVGPVRRVDTAKSHYYVDANKQRVPGVTTIIGDGIPKPALTNWAANSTAEYAVDNWADLTGLPLSQRLKELQGARYKEKDKAAKRGTEVHDLAAKAILGETVPVPEELAGYVESYVQFLDEFDVQPVLVEATVYNLTIGYAGTLDLIAEFPTLSKTLLCDIKTTRNGIFGDVALQLAGYRYAESYIDERGEPRPMPPVDGCAGIHVRADGYSLIPVTAGEQQLLDLRYAMQVRRFVNDSRDLVGAPVVPPSRLTRRRLEIVPDLEEAAS